jgi:hypothetical protein
MDWKTTLLLIDKFERMAMEKVKELKMHYHQIQQYEKSEDYESLTIEKINAKKMIDSMLDGFKQILSKRQEIPPDQHEAFDIRIEPIQRQTQAIINAIMTLIDEPHPPTSPTATKKNHGGGQYEQMLVEQTQTSAQKHVGDLQFKLERAKEDAEVTKKLAQDIEDLNQVMEDLAALVHSQHDIVDSIEEHVELAAYKVESGNRELKKALANKNAQVPLAAAAVGATAVGGPVGFVAGSAALGIMAGVGGAIAGIFGGRLLKKQAQEATKISTNEESNQS